MNSSYATFDQYTRNDSECRWAEDENYVLRLLWVHRCDLVFEESCHARMFRAELGIFFRSKMSRDVLDASVFIEVSRGVYLKEVLEN